MFGNKIHFMWINSIDEAPLYQVENIAKWRKLNPFYGIHLWEKASVVELIEDNYPQYLSLFHSLDKKIKQADLARLLVIHKHGGIYLDMDLNPKTSLDLFFESDCLYNDKPDIPSVTLNCSRNVKTILIREGSMIDKYGFGVTSGVTISEPNQDWIIEFIERKKNKSSGTVLNFLGPHALTRFLRDRLAKLPHSWNDFLFVPYHYFFWENCNFDRPPPDYVVCHHDGECVWSEGKNPIYV